MMVMPMPMMMGPMGPMGPMGGMGGMGMMAPMGGMGSMGYGGMGYGNPYGMGGYGATAEPVKAGANLGVPRAAWADPAEAKPGHTAEGLAPEPAPGPDAFTLLDDSFRAQLLHLRAAAARHRRALQETYLSGSRLGTETSPKQGSQVLIFFCQIWPMFLIS